ncbi:hypothetical protein [Maribacter antarcticus]|uniref:hypothetical protein n=1 Tax=Maribacter antarcticus TaxID=505250 RepID=UPI00047D3E63|nr:hypothetical protein [Maribacter antarcticus]
MKKASTILSLLFLGATLVSFKGYPQYQTQNNHINIYDIDLIEVEEELELGFDTAPYLPEGFNAYAGMETTLDNLGLVEIEENIDLGFNTKEYLPEGFNPYQGMIFAIEDIVVIEEEEEFILDFNTKKYLPNSFNALSK